MGGTWNYLDMTALGRQEEWEDLPEGYPPPPYDWWSTSNSSSSCESGRMKFSVNA